MSSRRRCDRITEAEVSTVMLKDEMQILPEEGHQGRQAGQEVQEDLEGLEQDHQSAGGHIRQGHG